MTRINCVPPSWLTGKHLVAEYRELPRVFALSKAAQSRGDDPLDYDGMVYTLGRGHVKFFYTRLRWCLNRQLDLIREMKDRGYSPTLTNPQLLMESQDPRWCGDWGVGAGDLLANLKRLVERDSTHYKILSV